MKIYNPNNMPTLDWIGKKAVVNHHNEVPFHLLKEAPDLSFGDPEAGNLIVEGDNLVALKALLPYYAGQVKCIYIDPPYNTGNENWIYNDNVNSPEIRRWLGKVVGGEMEDLSRHDKWLCMMYPRLALLREMLREDGAIFVSVDDNESGNIRLLLDEIFSEQNILANCIWQKKYTRSNDAKYFSDNHDHVFVYAKNKGIFKIGRAERTEQQDKAYKNPDGHPLGPWKPTPLHAKSGTDTSSFTFRNGVEWQPPRGTFRRFTDETMQRLDSNDEIWFGKAGNAIPQRKTFLGSLSEGLTPVTFWSHEVAGDNHEARDEVKSLLSDTHFGFDNPKPTTLLRQIIQLSADRDSIVLDSFAGSGTTGHAVMQLNKQDGGNRRFILVQVPFETDGQKQRDENIARDVTAERLRRVCKGYKKPNGEAVEGLGSGFRYCKLGPSVFGADGRINPEITFPELARHVFFTETGRPLPKQAKPDTPLIGVHQDKAVYLLYNGILNDKRSAGGNVLTQAVLNDLPKHEGPKIVYGTACRFSPARLKREKIVFKQIPYEIRIR